MITSDLFKWSKKIIFNHEKNQFNNKKKTIHCKMKVKENVDEQQSNRQSKNDDWNDISAITFVLPLFFRAKETLNPSLIPLTELRHWC